ncbi:MAG: DNA repair protein RecN [Nitrospirae bacterium]|nr:DNA repair protein RecN [Nitrospirota bacterium]
MLRCLRVKDFAIIDEASIDFTDGFTVFTGETGAGKSILIDAISLITGGRASADDVRDGKEEAVIEAVFDLDLEYVPAFKDKMDKYGISEDSDEIIIRRNISRNGKSRVFINGVLSTLLILDDISNSLVDIHGQHEHQSLLKKELHLEFLDLFGKLLVQKQAVTESYQHLFQIRNKLAKLEDDIRRKREKEDFTRFQYSEINNAGLRGGEDAELAKEKNILINSKRLSALSDDAYQLLYESDESVLSLLNRVENNINEIAGIDPSASEAKGLVSSSRINLKETAEFIRNFRERLVYDPSRLENIEERLYLIERLKKKYGTTIEAIMAFQVKLKNELDLLETFDDELDVIKHEIEQVSKDVEEKADELSALRMESKSRLESAVMKELSQLQMGGTKFVVDIKRTPLSTDGIDSVEFMIANFNEEPKPLVKVISGGELSRLMLALKSCLSSIDSVHTLLFDEVDTGIGGRTAEEVARKLKLLSKVHQVCCITHLPQIAAMADTHYSVEKVLENNRVVTRIKRLKAEERIAEIGRMLGGTGDTSIALRYAKELLGKAVNS